MDKTGQLAGNGHEVVVGVAWQVEMLTVHEAAPELRDEAEIPPRRQNHEQLDGVTHPGARKLERSREADDEKDRQPDEPPLSERSGAGPRIEASAHVDLAEDHHHADEHDPRARREPREAGRVPLLRVASRTAARCRATRSLARRAETSMSSSARHRARATDVRTTPGT